MTKNSKKLFKHAIIEIAKCTREKIQNAEKLQSELRQQRREARKTAEADEKLRIESEEKARFQKEFQIDTRQIELKGIKYKNAGANNIATL